MSDAVNNPYFSAASAQLSDPEEGGATDIDDVDVPPPSSPVSPARASPHER